MSYGDFIIDAFLAQPHRSLSGEELGRRVGVSRTAVWKKIKSLEREGYEFEFLKGKGYRLKKLTVLPLEREIKRNLAAGRLGGRIYYYPKVDSTNNVAKRLAREGAQEGTIVIAGQQSSGRGRRERRWDSPAGGIYMSIILTPEIHPSKIAALTLLSGLAVSKAVQSLHGIEVGLKWPNDLVINDKKLGGILCEMESEAQRINFIVVGIGIDVNCEVDVDIPTTSLKREIGGDAEIIPLVREVLERLDMLYDAFKVDPAAFIKEYNENSQTLGRDVKIIRSGGAVFGRAVDISADGSLTLRLADGSYEQVLSGDCIHLR